MTDYTAGITEDNLKDALKTSELLREWVTVKGEHYNAILQLALEGLAARKVQAEAAAMRKAAKYMIQELSETFQTLNEDGEPQPGSYLDGEPTREVCHAWRNLAESIDSDAGLELLEELEQLRKLKPIADRMAEALVSTFSAWEEDGFSWDDFIKNSDGQPAGEYTYKDLRLAHEILAAYREWEKGGSHE